MLFDKTYKFLFFFAVFILQISAKEIGPIEIGPSNCRIIQLGDSLVYIFNKEDNNNIYKYNLTEPIATYSSAIKLNKDILKINDNKYIIIGVDNSYNFYIDTFDFPTSRTPTSKKTSLTFSELKQLEGRIVNENILFLYGIEKFSYNLILYKIDLSGGSPQQLTGPNDLYGTNRNIQCDAMDGSYVFCIISLTYETETEKTVWKMIYFRRDFQSIGSVINYGKICEKDCYLGNILIISDKYLVCYHHEGLILSFKCQYYSFDNNNNIIISKTYELGQSTMIKKIEKPLLLRQYESSIFLISDLNSDGIRMGLLIESSLDFRINIKSYIMNNFELSLNLFIVNNNLYYFYQVESSKTTNLWVKDFYECKTDYLTITNEDEYYSFYNTNDNNQLITFSLDENVKLFRGGEDIGSPPNNYITLINENYTFKKMSTPGVYINYYAYVSDGDSGVFNSYSLICPLRVVQCPESCKTCDPNKNVSPTEHYCTECNDGYLRISGESIGSTFNCYQSDDEKIIHYYNDNGVYKRCDDSCKSCINGRSCRECEDNYYFIANNDNTINADICHQYDSSDPYYLDLIDKKIVYKRCYQTCSTCSSGGNEASNNCLSCKDGYKKYTFSEYQCTIDSESCLEKNQYWTFSNNNVQCVSKCDNYIVFKGTNRGQCIESCENFINPNSISSSNNLYSITCNGGQKYCIPFEICDNDYFVVDYILRITEKKGGCIVDFFGGKDNLHDPPPTEDASSDITIDEKEKQIKYRKKITKVSTENKNYSLKNNYELSLINEYLKLLDEEERKLDDNIYLISSKHYLNCIITIYPLDIEDYTYEKIFLPNDLGFVNFTNFFSDYLTYEIKQKKIIIAGIVENKVSNASINDLNYFLYSFNDITQNLYKDGRLLTLNNIGNNNGIEILYPLHNYINDNSVINKRNKEHLVDNINYMHEKYPKVELSNISDPFYNDICFLFTSEVGTDMTLNDRRNEYYVNISLCENNCVLLKVINKDETPRSVCKCGIKTGIMLGNTNGKNDTIKSYSVQNSKSFICISESFNHSISKNGIFWIFIIIIIIQIYLLVMYIKYKDKIINEMLGLYDKNNQEINRNNSIRSSNEDSQFIEYKKNDIEKNSDKVDSQNEEVMSAPLNAPPKRKIDYRRPNSTTKTDIKEEKDLISGNESSIVKESTIKLNEKNQPDYTDMSFDDIQHGYEFFKIDNLFDKKDKMLQDNYLKDPILEERLQKMKKIKKHLRPFKKTKKYIDTCGDNWYLNRNKFNKRIAIILGGKDLLHKKLIENNSDNENNPRYQKTRKIIDLSSDDDKGIFSDDQIIFSSGALRANKKLLIDEDDFINKAIKLKKNNNAYNSGNKMSLAKSLGKAEIKQIEEEEKNNDQRIKTEIDIDASNKIKKELTKIGKGHDRPRSTVLKNKKKRKINSSAESDHNALKKPKAAKPLQLIEDKESKKDENYNMNINKKKKKNKEDIIKVMDSKRVMIDFQEEGGMYGDEGVQNIEEDEDEDEKKIKDNRTRNLELLNGKIYLCSMTENVEIDNKELLVEENFKLYFWKYFMKRELWITCIKDKKDSIPYLVRYSCLLFSFSFIFLLNCFLFLESDVHKRYLNALSGKKNGLGYYFKHEFGTTICVSLLANLFKILIIKLVLIKLFKIGESAKKIMRSSAEKGLTKNELDQLQLKRQNYLIIYKKNLLIYFACMMGLNCFIAYICICYGGVFHNSIGAFFYGLLFSLIFSFIFCAVICLGIVALYRLGKYLKSKCVVSAYIVLSTLY